jgi:hypothetical protein
MAYSHTHRIAQLWRFREPVHFASDDSITEQLFAWPDYHGAVFWPDGNDIHWPGEAAGDATPLADGVPSESLVFTDSSAARCDDGSG